MNRVSEFPDLPGYRVLGYLGAGGFAEVWKVESPAGLIQAAKILHAPEVFRLSARQAPGQEGDYEDAVRRFISEACSLAQLQHPHIVRFYADGRAADGRPFLTLEYCGESLATRLGLVDSRARGSAGLLRTAVSRLPWDEAVGVVSEVLDALEHLHGRGLIHRDVKPSNVLLGEDDLWKLSDFNLAKDIALSTGAAKSSRVLGTADYMAPEARRGHAERRSDIWSVGALLFRCVTGESYQGGLEDPHEDWPHVPVDLWAVIETALKRNAYRRFENAGAMRAALKQALLPTIAESSGAAALPVQDSALEPSTSAVASSVAVELPKAVQGVEGSAWSVVEPPEKASPSPAPRQPVADPPPDWTPADLVRAIQRRDYNGFTVAAARFLERGESLNEAQRHRLDAFVPELVVSAAPHVIELLLRLGADPDAIEDSGDTALHRLADQEVKRPAHREEAVRLLLAHSACPHQEDSDGRTPRQRTRFDSVRKHLPPDPIRLDHAVSRDRLRAGGLVQIRGSWFPNLRCEVPPDTLPGTKLRLEAEGGSSGHQTYEVTLYPPDTPEGHRARCARLGSAGIPVGRGSIENVTKSWPGLPNMGRVRISRLSRQYMLRLPVGLSNSRVRRSGRMHGRGAG